MSDKDRPTDDAPDPDGKLEEAFFDEEKVAAIKAELEAESSEPYQSYDPEVEGDDELQRVMGRRKPARHPIAAGIVAVVCIGFMVWFWQDFRYWLRSNTPEQLGPVSKAVADGRLEHNTYVSVKGRAVTQTMANGKEKPGPLGSVGKKPFFMWVLAGSGNKVVVRSSKPLILNRGKPGPKKVRTNVFTGRLRKLDKTGYRESVRSFYRRLSKVAKGLQREHQLTAAAVLQGAGKAPYSTKDVRGTTVTIKRDTTLALFVTFPGDYEFKVHTEVTDPLKGVTVAAGKGAKACGKPDEKTGLPPTGRGGSVYVKVDPKTVSLDALAKARSYSAGDAAEPAKAGEAPDDGKDLVLSVPPGTVVFNGAKRDCRYACQQRGGGAKAACKKSCSAEKGVQITPDAQGRILVAVGGRCGGFAGEKHVVNFQGQPYQSAKRAEAYVASLGFPYALVEDASKTPRKVVNFILRAPKAEALKILKRQTRHSPYNIAPRYDVFYAQWRHLKRQGPDLVITRTNRGYPQHYTVKATPQGKRLVAVPHGATLALPPARIEKAEMSLLMELPADTYLLQEGVTPSHMWSEPYVPGVPVFYLVLLVLFVVNLLALRAHFRG